MDSVDNTAKRPEDMTMADIKATLAEAAVLSKKNEIEIEKFRESIAESSREFNARMDRMAEAREKEAKEREKSYAELHKAIFGVNEEREKEAKEREKSYAELRDLIYGVGTEVNGISNSNGMVAEDYFFETLKKTKTLGGIHFDGVIRNMTNILKLEDGTILNDEYDTVMINDTAVCVVEVKYKVERKDVKKLAKKRVLNFKKLFPMYANYKIYLAFGGLTFQKGAIDTAKELGMGVLRLNGDAVEIDDDNLKAY